jgi:uncharacterized protein YbjQ (UPF0145 family)
VIVVTSSQIAGARVVKTLGIVRGTTVRSRHIGKDILALFRNLVGGEIPEYTKMLAESREEALDRMLSDAEILGANAILDARFSTASVAAGTAEILCYGTAVIIETGENPAVAVATGCEM